MGHGIPMIYQRALTTMSMIRALQLQKKGKVAHSIMEIIIDDVFDEFH